MERTYSPASYSPPRGMTHCYDALAMLRITTGMVDLLLTSRLGGLSLTQELTLREVQERLTQVEEIVSGIATSAR